MLYNHPKKGLSRYDSGLGSSSSGLSLSDSWSPSGADIPNHTNMYGVNDPKINTVKTTTITVVPKMIPLVDFVNVGNSKNVTPNANATAPLNPENHIKTWCLNGIGGFAGKRFAINEIIKIWVREIRIDKQAANMYNVSYTALSPNDKSPSPRYKKMKHSQIKLMIRRVTFESE